MTAKQPTPQGVALAATYHFRVEVDGPPGTRKGVLYDGPDPADAMAAWSKAISQGKLYVTLEALRESPLVSGAPFAGVLATKDGDNR